MVVWYQFTNSCCSANAIFVRWYQTQFPGVEVEGTIFFNVQIFCPHNNYMCVLDAAYLEGLPGALFVELHVRTYESRFPYSYNALYVRFTHWAPSGFICCFHSCRTPRTQRQMTTGHHSMSSYFVTAYHTMNFFCFVGF